MAGADTAQGQRINKHTCGQHRSGPQCLGSVPQDLHSRMMFEILHYGESCSTTTYSVLHVHGLHMPNDVDDREILRHRVGGVLHPEDLAQDEIALRDVVLQPQVLHFDVPEFPQTFSRQCCPCAGS